MNLNNADKDLFFNQHCIELAKLLRTERTEDFLHLYDSLPSEWNGSRLEEAKEYIRQLQELNENEFECIYQRIFHNEEKQHSSTILMSQLPMIHNDDEQINNRITSISNRQQRTTTTTTTNNLVCDEKHDISSKNSSSIKRNNDETNTKTRRLQSITNNNNNNNNSTHIMLQNNCRTTRTPVDSFVQLNLKPSIDITVEEYKKTRGPMSTTKTGNTTNRLTVSQSTDTNQSSITQPNVLKNHKTSIKNKSHEESNFDYFSKMNNNNNNNDDDNGDRQHSRSSSSSSSPKATITNRFTTSLNNKNDLSINQTFSQSKSYEHSKLIPNNDFDSHGSSIATKSSSENSGSTRNGSATDSDDEHRKNTFQSTKKSSILSKPKSLHNDDTPTIVLNKISNHPTSQHDRISSLPQQDSYELVQLNVNDEHDVRASQVPRFKLPAIDDPNGINNSTNDVFSYTTQRSPQNNVLASSHQNRNPEHHEQYNTNHSNSSRKPSGRTTKKRKQSNQQEIIRTELIPGHRGDLDVDELVMFIDGNSTSKQKQRHNSAPLRSTDTNKFKTISSLPDTNSNTTTTATNINNNTTTSRRKSRKPIKIIQESINNNENKTSQIDEDIQSIEFIDDDDDLTTTHSINNTYNEENITNISLPNDDESHSNTIDIDTTNDSNTTNGEISLPEWLEPIHSTSSTNDDIDSFSLSSSSTTTTINNLNSEIISEPFVTVTHRRRLTKERRQDNNSLLSKSSRLPLSSNINDKRRFQSSTSTQNGIIRSTIRNSLSNIKPFISTTKEEHTNRISSSPPPSSQAISQTSVQPTSIPPPQSQPPPPPPTSSSSSMSNHVIEQSSPRLSSHSSSSSLPSLLKRQSKAPPVVFLNKSIDIELNDVSFGFDVENPITDKPLTPTSSSLPIEKEIETESNILSSLQLNDSSINLKSSSSRRSYQQQQQQQQRNNRGLLFYSGSDIRPQQQQQHHHRNYPSQSSYIDPLLLLSYNQSRFATNYSQQLAYMNLLRTQYLSSPSPYVLIPTTYTTTTNDIEQDSKIHDDDNDGINQTSEQMQEPLLIYATIPTQTGPIYLQSTKKSYYELEQLQQSSMSTMYPAQYFYPTQTQHIPSHTAYFQPITSPSLLIDTKSQQDDTDNDDDDDVVDNNNNNNNDYDKSTRLFHQTQQQSSSHIMSNALQLVYSQEKRNLQTDRFNLDQLTAYLAMKWTDTINHYEQGDDEILLMGEQ
ncbi:unnamed protein product [Rotaria sordida]|uniref:Uncharacterized protein n=2 Tax=Rotaria sordida TaxID=392033 RepID=A0A814CW64_9BILA|nr:unnamed protein product [Rotaria sordida]CAF1245562.1 unnamed protein product [Rotaria sordida]